MKAIILSESDWSKIKQMLEQTQPKSVMLTRWKMKKVLGFTPREHEEWVVFDHTGDRERRMLKRSIHLDFYSEQQRTMFLLKYSELIKNENR